MSIAPSDPALFAAASFATRVSASIDTSLSSYLFDDEARASGELVGLDQVELVVNVEASDDLGLCADLN